MAADPVSPEVAPTTVKCSRLRPSLPLLRRTRKYWKRLPRNWSATSLNANVQSRVSSDAFPIHLPSTYWAVEELQQVDFALLVERDGGGDVRGAKGGIALCDDLAEILRRDLIGRDVQRKDVVRELLERAVAPAGLPVLRKRGDLLGDEETAVRGETLEYDLLEGEPVRATAGA
jgi:hypothetical protein